MDLSFTELGFRYCLGFKRQPFKTIWVEYPNISDKLKELEAAPGGIFPMELPTIHFP